MKRGDVVTVAMTGDFGKPRPAVIVQSDLFDATGTVAVLLITSTVIDAPLLRLRVEPSPDNGLRLASDLMVDKVMSVRRDRVGPVIGRLDDDVMLAASRSLALFLGIA